MLLLVRLIEPLGVVTAERLVTPGLLVILLLFMNNVTVFCLSPGLVYDTVDWFYNEVGALVEVCYFKAIPSLDPALELTIDGLSSDIFVT